MATVPFKPRSGPRRLPATIAGLALTAFATASTTALAQQDTSVQRVEITGSSIKRIQSEGALPIQSFTRKEIEESGATTATELIQKLPAMQGFVTLNESVGGGGAGYASASLRSLGDRTLILLNGKRLASWAGQTITGYGNGIDLDTIPIAAIERVEVLTDGASSLYGSDAIAGVVNFITRSNYEKFEAYGQYLKPQKTGGQESRFSLTKGFGNPVDNGYNFMIAYSEDHVDPIKATDRDFAKTGNVFYTQGGQTLNFLNPSSRAIPANILWAGGGIGNPYYAGVGPYAANAGTCPPLHIAEPTGAPFCYFDYVASLEVQPKVDRNALLLSGTWKLDDNNTVYGQYVNSKSKVLSRIAPPPVDMTINNTQSFWATYVAPVINNPAITTATARWRIMDAGNRTTTDTTTADHLVGGMKGYMIGWDYDYSLTYSRNTWVEDYDKGWMTANGLIAALSAGTLNPFLLPGQQSAAGQATIDGAQYTGEFKRAETTMTSANLHGSHEAFDAPGGKAMLGAGFDARKERSTYTPSLIAQGVGDNIAGDTSAERGFDVSRKVLGLFGELQIPLRKGLDMTGSLRTDHYSDFGNTTNGKVSVRWQPTREWLFRGSAGTGYKAPSVPQTADIKMHYGVTGGSYTCPAWVPAALAGLCIPGTTQYDQFAAGNPNLTPEKSKQLALGTRWEPNNQLSIGVDYWWIHLKDRIGQVSETLVFSDPTYANLFTSYYDPVQGKNVLAILLANQNQGEAVASGLDFDIVGRLTFGAARLNSRLLWTNTLKHDVQDVAGGPWHSDLGIFASGLGSSDGPVFRNVYRWFNTVEYTNWSHTLTFSYKSSYVDQNYDINYCGVTDLAGNCVASDHTVDAYYTFDWQTNYQLGKSLKLSAGIINMFDKDPPFSLRSNAVHPIGWDPRYTDARGRTWWLSARYEM